MDTFRYILDAVIFMHILDALICMHTLDAGVFMRILDSLDTYRVSEFINCLYVNDSKATASHLSFSVHFEHALCDFLKQDYVRAV